MSFFSPISLCIFPTPVEIIHGELSSFHEGGGVFTPSRFLEHPPKPPAVLMLVGAWGGKKTLCRTADLFLRLGSPRPRSRFFWCSGLFFAVFSLGFFFPPFCPFFGDEFPPASLPHSGGWWNLGPSFAPVPFCF